MQLTTKKSSVRSGGRRDTSRALSVALRARLVALADKHPLTPSEAAKTELCFAVNHAKGEGLEREGLLDLLGAAVAAKGGA